MVRFNLFLPNEYMTFLRSNISKEVSIAEHVRRALSDYMNKLESKNSSVSPSKPLK